jgi:hypothetical protein
VQREGPAPATAKAPALVQSEAPAPSPPVSTPFPEPDLSLPADGSRPAKVHPLGLLSFFFGSVGLLLASSPMLDIPHLGFLSQLDVLSKPLSGLGLLLGLAGILAVLDLPWGIRKLVPIGSSVMCLLTLLLAGPWPGSGPPRIVPPDPAEILVIPPDQGKSVRKPLPAGDWFDATQGELQQQGVRIKITDVSVGGVIAKSEGKRPTEVPCLAIRVRIANTGLVRWIKYRSLTSAAAGTPALRLTDNTGRVIHLYQLPPGWKPDGPIDQASLPPGESAKDVLLFELPAAPVETFRLELPASAFEGVGTFRFQIPRSMVKGW